MHTRKANILIALVWVLLFQPGFCVAGWLEHSCEDAKESHSHGCECANDPCDQIKLPDVTLRPDQELPLPELSPVFADDFDNASTSGISVSREIPAFACGTTRDRPFPDSDLPLLN